jgi:hypothetical protein
LVATLVGKEKNFGHFILKAWNTGSHGLAQPVPKTSQNIDMRVCSIHFVLETFQKANIFCSRILHLTGLKLDNYFSNFWGMTVGGLHKSWVHSIKRNAHPNLRWIL